LIIEGSGDTITILGLVFNGIFTTFKGLLLYIRTISPIKLVATLSGCGAPAAAFSPSAAVSTSSLILHMLNAFASAATVAAAVAPLLPSPLSTGTFLLF